MTTSLATAPKVMLSREVCTIAFGSAAEAPPGERDFISLSPLSEYLTEEDIPDESPAGRDSMEHHTPTRASRHGGGYIYIYIYN